MHEMNQRRDDPVLMDLFDDTVVGSLMQWTPQMGESNLNIVTATSVEQTKNTKVVDTRSDRKFSYALPACPDTANFTLVEETLTWLGVGIGGGCYAKHTYSGTVRHTINGIPVNSTVSMQKHVKEWINFAEKNVPRASQYVLGVCKVVGALARCPFEHVKTVEEACNIWSNGSNIDQIPCPKETGNVGNICRAWYSSPEGKARSKLHGQMTGDWGKCKPQVNYIVGVKTEH
jgi:hypothetical protein